jgi:hypothetical protein
MNYTQEIQQILLRFIDFFMDGVPPGDNDLVGCIGCLNKNLKIFDFSTVKKLKIVL